MAKKTEKKSLSRLKAMEDLISNEKKRAIKEDDNVNFGHLEDFNTANIFNTEPLGFLALDKLFGGFIPGRMYEIYGQESSGKSTTSLQIIEKLQMVNPDISILYIDAEQTVNFSFLQRFPHLDISKIVLMQENLIEEIWKKIIKFTEEEAVDVIFVDSIGALETTEETKKSLYENTMAVVARKLSRGLKSLYTLLPKKNVSIFFINQERTAFKGQFAVQDTMGGKALKFATSLRMEVKADKSKNAVKLNERGDISEVLTSFYSKKSKISEPYRTTYSYLNVDRNQPYAFNSISDVVETALTEQVIIQKGSYYYINDPETGEEIKFQGRAKLENHFSQNLDFYLKTKLLCYSKIYPGDYFYALYDKIINLLEKESYFIQKDLMKIDKKDIKRNNLLKDFGINIKNFLDDEEIKSAEDFCEEIKSIKRNYEPKKITEEESTLLNAIEEKTEVKENDTIINKSDLFNVRDEKENGKI